MPDEIKLPKFAPQESIIDTVYEFAQKIQDSETKIRKFIDALLASGYSIDKVNAALEVKYKREAEQLKVIKQTNNLTVEMGSKFNKSLRDLASTPVHKLFGDFRATLTSVFRIMPGINQALLVFSKTLLEISKQRAETSKFVSPFTVASGLVGQGLASTIQSPEVRTRFIHLQRDLTKMGMSSEEQQQLGGLVAKTTPRRALDQVQESLPKAIAAFAKTTSLSPELLTQATGLGIRRGGRADNMLTTITDVSMNMEQLKNIPSEEIAQGFLEIYKVSSLFGDSEQSVKRGMAAWSKFLESGQISAGSIAQLRGQEFGAQSTDLMRLAAISEQFGIAVAGETPLDKAATLREEFGKDDGMEFFKRIDSLTTKLAESDQFRDLGGPLNERKLLVQQKVLSGVLNEEMSRAVVTGKLPSVRPQSREDIEKASKDAIGNAVELREATRSIGEMFSDHVKALKKDSEALIEHSRIYSGPEKIPAVETFRLREESNTLDY